MGIYLAVIGVVGLMVVVARAELNAPAREAGPTCPHCGSSSLTRALRRGQRCLDCGRTVDGGRKPPLTRPPRIA